MSKSPDAFRTISEVADWLGVQAHVLRFWESKFSHIKPVKRAGGRRYYRPNDMRLIGGIKKLLHDDGMTIKGVQKLLREQGVEHVWSLSPALDEAVASSFAAASGGPTVVAFQEKPEASDGQFRPDIEDALAVSQQALDMPDDADDEVADESPAVADRRSGRLPAFLRQEVEKQAAEVNDGAPEPAPATEPMVPEPVTPDPDPVAPDPAPRRARVINAPDPPSDAEIPARLGLLTRVVALRSVDVDEADELAPIVDALKALRAKLQSNPAA